MTRFQVFVRVVVFHVLVLTAVVLVPMLKSCEWFPKKEQIIQVDLASLPPLPPEDPQEEDPEDEPDEEVVSEATPVPTPPPRPTATPRPESTPVPTATPRPQPTPTPKPTPKPTPTWRAATPDEIAERIRNQQQNTPPPAAPTLSPQQIREIMEAGLPSGGGTGITAGPAGQGNSVNMGGVDGEVQRRANSAWNQPVHLSAASGLSAVGRVTVSRDGSISGGRILRSSGNMEFDDSVKKALSLVKFAKALPDSYTGASYTVDITFELTE